MCGIAGVTGRQTPLRRGGHDDRSNRRFGLADAGNIYGRLTNSTQDVLEKRVAALEGGVAALAVAAAAITYTIQALAQAGDHIVAQKTIYGGSFNLLSHTLPLYGISTAFVDAHDLAHAPGRRLGFELYMYRMQT